VPGCGCGASPAPALPLARPPPRNVLLPVNTFIFNCRCRAGGGRGGQELVGSGCLRCRAVNSPGGQSDSDVSIRAPAPRQPPCRKGFCSGLWKQGPWWGPPASPSPAPGGELGSGLWVPASARCAQPGQWHACCPQAVPCWVEGLSGVKERT